MYVVITHDIDFTSDFCVGRGILDAPQIWCCAWFVLPTFVLPVNIANVGFYQQTWVQIPRRVWETAPYGKITHTTSNSTPHVVPLKKIRTADDLPSFAKRVACGDVTKSR